jgi:hypothetical protein
MELISIYEGESCVSGRGPGTRENPSESLGFAHYPPKKKNRSGEVGFLFGEKLLKKARFIIGDKIELLHDRDLTYGIFKRVVDGKKGAVICKATSKSYAKIHLRGKPIFPEIRHAINLQNVKVEDEGISFAWPKIDEVQ